MPLDNIHAHTFFEGGHKNVPDPQDGPHTQKKRRKETDWVNTSDIKARLVFVSFLRQRDLPVKLHTVRADIHPARLVWVSSIEVIYCANCDITPQARLGAKVSLCSSILIESKASCWLAAFCCNGLFVPCYTLFYMHVFENVAKQNFSGFDLSTMTSKFRPRNTPAPSLHSNHILPSAHPLSRACSNTSAGG